MKHINKLTFAALLIAFEIIAVRFLYVQPLPSVRISPQFLAHALSGWLLGPIWAIGTAVSSDLLRMFIFPSPFPYFPGYTLSAALHGLIYGLVLYKKRPNLFRSASAVCGSILVISTCLNTYWSAIITHTPWGANLLVGIAWRILSIAIYIPILYAVQKGLSAAKLSDRTWSK